MSHLASDELGAMHELGSGISGIVEPGDGEKVLWIHGYTMDSTIWRELWLRLPGWYHIGIDLPGHGASRPIANGETLPALADALVNLALEHSVRHLVALSFGTMVALQMAIQHPRTFASIVLGAPALAGVVQDSEAAARYEALMRLYYQRGPGPHLRALWMRSPPNIFKGAEAHPALWEQLSTIIDKHTWAELANGRLYRLINHLHTPADLGNIQTATLILLGNGEMPAYRKCADLIREWLPNCAYFQIQDAGHLCLLEAPHIACEQIARHLHAHRAASPLTHLSS